MQVFKKDNKGKTVLLLGSIIKRISYEPKKKPVAIFDNGTQDALCCAKCLRPRCIFLDDEEVSCDYLKDFSFEKNEKVCPVDAIKINDKDGFPAINNEQCIKCGACARRCPFGALYFDPNLCVNKIKSKYQNEAFCDTDAISSHNQNIRTALKAIKTGIMIKENRTVFSRIYNSLSLLKPHAQNYVARDVLLSLNCECSLRRIGDVYTRMDAVYKCNNYAGPVEIEFGRDSLDASRAILDDLAVLNVRYSLPIKKAHPLVIFLTLPNARQGYWQVVKDIERVESFKINTISLGALFLMNWHFVDLNDSGIDFYLDYDQMCLREMLSQKIGNCSIDIPNGLLGICEPEK
jgi:ferredoxin